MGLFYVQLLSVYTICAQIGPSLQHPSSMLGSWESSGSINTQLEPRKPPHSRASWPHTPALRTASQSRNRQQNPQWGEETQTPGTANSLVSSWKKKHVPSSIYSDLRTQLDSCSLLDPWLLNRKQQRNDFEVLYEAAIGFLGGILSRPRQPGTRKSLDWLVLVGRGSCYFLGCRTAPGGRTLWILKRLIFSHLLVSLMAIKKVLDM